MWRTRIRSTIETRRLRIRLPYSGPARKPRSVMQRRPPIGCKRRSGCGVSRRQLRDRLRKSICGMPAGIAARCHQRFASSQLETTIHLPWWRRSLSSGKWRPVNWLPLRTLSREFISLVCCPMVREGARDRDRAAAGKQLDRRPARTSEIG